MLDQQTGQITTGKGAHPRVYAIGVLSVGAKAATWPIVFEPRRSFRAPALPAAQAGAAAARARARRPGDVAAHQSSRRPTRRR